MAFLLLRPDSNRLLLRFMSFLVCLSTFYQVSTATDWLFQLTTGPHGALTHFYIQFHYNIWLAQQKAPPILLLKSPILGCLQPSGTLGDPSVSMEASFTCRYLATTAVVRNMSRYFKFISTWKLPIQFVTCNSEKVVSIRRYTYFFFI
jgi:hypothetical protein